MKTKVISLSKIASLLIVLSLGFGLTAHAQWGWTDKDGRRIFSDQAPSSEVPDKNVFKRPGGARAQAAVAKAAEPEAAASAPAGGASAAKVAASAPKLSGKDAELEKKKKEAEAAEAAKKKAADEKFAADRAENCERAKKSKASYASGVRIATTNAKGEREIMSDTDRAAESKRLEGLIATECK
jgi:Domain of unknown function (DUF4124)